MLFLHPMQRTEVEFESCTVFWLSLVDHGAREHELIFKAVQKVSHLLSVGNWVSDWWEAIAYL